MSRKYPKKKYTDDQRAWCELYEAETGFEPHAMADYEAGEIDFVTAARFSLQWFEDWSGDAYNRISRGGIPGTEFFVSKGGD